MDYNIFLELAVIPMDLIIYCFLVMRYKNPTRVNLAFRTFTLLVLIGDIIDIITALITGMRNGVQESVHYFFNTLDCVLASFACFAYIYYNYAYVNMEKKERVIRGIVNYSVLWSGFILLILNYFTGWVFFYDSEMNYIHGPLFTLVAYGIPLILFLIGSTYILFHRDKYKREQIIALGLGIVVMLILFLFQMLFFDNVLITFFIASMGVLLIFLSLETPDYVELVRTMNELHEAREREAVAETTARLSGELMMALSEAVDMKDHYTNGHSLRVAGYSREIASRMGMSDKELNNVYAMGLLHDIGKIGISNRIINKKDSLTDEEYEEIKRHTTMGYDILKRVKEFPMLAEGARWHHERYDGKGYPDGIKGDDIPIGARIVAIADAYDAMTSYRSYSSVRPRDDVRAEILRCRGKRFDPEVTDIMLSMIDEDTEYRMRQSRISDETDRCIDREIGNCKENPD